MAPSARPSSPALERYNALRAVGMKPDDAAKQVEQEFPNLAELHPEAVVQKGPKRTKLEPDEEAKFRDWYSTVSSGADLDPDPDHPLHKYDWRGSFKAQAIPEIAPSDGKWHWPSEFKDADHPNRFVGGVDTKALDSGQRREAKATVTPGPITPVRPSAFARLASPAPVQSDATATRPAPRVGIRALTVGAAPERRPTDYAVPEPTWVDKWRQWRDKNAEQTMAAFDPKKIGTPEGRDAMLGIVMNMAEGPKVVGDAATGLAKVAGRAFPDPVPARATGKIIPDVPLFADQQQRMFKPGDFDLSPEGRAQLEGILGPTGIKERVTWKDAEALAEQIGTDPAKILRNVRDLSGEEVLAVKKAIATDTERVVFLSKIADDPATTREAKSAALEEINRRSSDLAQYAARVTRETSRTGRDLNLMKVMAKNTMEPSVWLVQASRMKGLPLTAEETVTITRLAAQRDREGLFDALSNLKTLDPLDKFLTTWKAGLLTNPLTHMVNVGGNTAMAIMEQGKDAPAAVADLLMSLATGTRTKAFPSLGGVASSVRGAATNGLEAANAVLRTGASPEDLAKWDFRGGRFGKTLGSDKVGSVLDLYTQGVFRSLGAEDQIFKAAAVGRSLDEQIRAEAINIAKRTKGTRAPISVGEAEQMLRANVPDAMQAQAIADAEFATFQNDNMISGAVSAGKRYLASKGPGGQAARGVVDLNLPFVKTPSNVLERTLDYTPAGILRAVAPAWKMAKGVDMDANQRKVAEAFGRASIGSLLVWLGYEMAGSDMATGTLPLGAKDEWDIRGRIPGAVRTSPKGDWHQVVRMQPIGTLITIGAQLRSVVENAASGSDVVGGAAATVGKVVADQPFLQGVKNIRDATEDPEGRGGRWVRSTAASVVPAVVGAVAREVDSTTRDPQTIAEAVKARVPGLSKSVPAKVNAFGEDQSHKSFPGAQLVDITRSRKNTETPALAELRRLGIALSKPGKTITVDGKTYALSRDEYADVQRQVGSGVKRLLEAAIVSPAYARQRKTPELTDLAHRDLLQDAIRDARSRVQKELAKSIHNAEKNGADHVGILRLKKSRF